MSAEATFEIPTAGVDRVRCAECAARACEALRQMPGVERAECDEPRGLVRLVFDDARVSEAELRLALEHFGLSESRRLAHAAWRVTGLD